MKLSKRTLSFLLVLAMLISLSVPAFAADTDTAASESSDNAFDAEAHDSQMARKEAMFLSVSDSSQMIGNNYIQFYVMDSDDSENSGRFTIGNTGGNPNYSSDDNQILLFGHPDPWSSYTTIRINSTNYIFKADKTTYDPSGLKAVSTMTVENVLITQTLQIVTNDGTGLKDTVQISYTAQNQSNVAKNIAIRIMLDTMLGDNDGAPFKVPSLGNVVLERELSGNAIPSYWQAFDSLSDASVFAVGTLYKGTDRKPDKVQFTAWSNVYEANNAWNYTIDPSNYVTGDSAVAVYWDSARVAAGSSTNVATYYGVGYANSGSSSTEASTEVPSNGFAVQIMDEGGNPVEGASIEVTNILSHPTIVTGADGIAVFNSIPRGRGNTRKVQLNVTKDGYQKITAAERNVDKGGLTAVTIYLDDGKVHISSAIGQIDGSSVDLISNYKYFKANSSDIKEADDKNNVKSFTINVTASGGAQISKYQLLQGGSIVAESNTSAITIPVLTGTPSNPNSFGSDWRITKLKAGQGVYLRVVDVNGVVSDPKPLGIKVSEPTVYGAGDSKGKLNFGEKLKINVPSNIPIIGDTEIELGWNGLPFIFEVSQSGKVKFAINPKASIGEGSVDGTDLSNWDEVEKDYKDAMEQAALGRSSAAKAFGGTPQKFGAGQLSVDADIMGYGEGYIDDNGNIIVDVGVVITISEKGSYTWTFFLGYVPVYISVGEKVSLTGKGEVGVTCTNGTWKVSGAVGEINPKITLNVDGGVGANGVLNIGASGRGTLSWLNRWTDNYNRVNLTGEMYIVAQAFLFKAEKKLASGTWTIYDSYSRSALTAPQEALNYDFYDSSAYSPIDRSYLSAPMLLSADLDTVKANVYPDASPRLVQVGDTAYLFWLDDIAERADNDRTALVYATSQDCETWSAPIQVIPETSDSTADLAYDVYVDGSDIHIAISKANKQFGAGEITLDDMAASADIYYVKLDTTNNIATEAQRITDNEYADTMPAVVVNGRQIIVAYAENRLEGGLFGTNNSYNVCYQIVGGETATLPIEGLITELDAGILDGQVSVGYVVDTDKNYNTDGDTELWIASASGNEGKPIKCASTGIYSPTFSTAGLLWYSNGNISCLDQVGETAVNVFDTELPTSLSQSFYVIEGSGNAKITWEAMSENEDTYETAVYAVDYDGNVWSNAYVLFETESELTSVLSGYSNDTNDFIAYIKTSGVSYDSQSTSLCVEAVTPPTDIAILDVDYVMNDVLPGEALPMVLTIQNCGATTIDSFSVATNGEVIATINNASLGRGVTETYEIGDFVVPSTLIGASTYNLSVNTQNDSNRNNNSVEFAIGYTDVSVAASPLLVGGEDWASVTITNDSNIVADVTLRIIADEKDGAVLFEQKFTDLTKDISQAILLDLDSLGGEADVRVFYITVTADQEELATADNEDLIYLGLGRTATYSLSVSASTGGTIVGNASGLYAEGDNISISALPDDGYAFAGWTSSGGGSFGNASAADTTFTMPANDVTVTATFKHVDSSNQGGGGGSSSSSNYSINVPTHVTGGTVSVSPTSASEGSKVTITAKPNSGYKVGGVAVTDKDGKHITVTDAGDNKYTFTMPGSKVDVKVEFVHIQNNLSFTDVQPDAYYYDAVTWAVEKGITAGTSATTFSPNDSCTRAQIVTFLWRAAGSPNASTNSPFTDVPVDSYYYDAVMWAVEQGITSGTSATTFSPDATCTRAQAVTFLYRYEKSPTVSETNNFVDVDTDAYYADAVQWAVGKNVTAGTSATTFSPNATCTRAQIVTFLYRDMA